MAIIPKLALIPSGYKAGKLYSVLPTNGDGDFTTTRNTVATRVNENGLIEEVASNVPRLDYSDGSCPSLLLEPERLQKIQYSEDFSNAYWTKSGASVTSGFVSPKGDLSAFKLTEDSTLNNHRISVNGLIGSGTHTISVLAKANDRNWLLIRNAANNAWFDVSNGVVGNVQSGTGSIENYGNGWYRCSVTMSSLSTPAIGIADNNDSYSYQGDGTSGIYIFGVQVEQGSYSTSYIPNYGTSAGITRSADTANGAGNDSTFNDSEGVFMVEASALGDVGGKWIALSNGTTNERLSIALQGDTVRVFIKNTSGTIWDYSVSAFVLNFNKIAVKFKSSDYALWINGIEIQTSTNANIVANLNSLQFDSGGGASNFYGNTKQVQYFDSALNYSDLEKLTSWTSFTAMANALNYTII